jgi:hypothetical protein
MGKIALVGIVPGQPVQARPELLQSFKQSHKK